MNVVVTGSSGNLGSKVLEVLKNEHNFTPIGRNPGEYPWQLGVRLDPAQFQNTDAILHFAWSLKDRANDVHLNVGGTAELARFAEQLGVPFIFISSISASGDSFYGKSKRLAEEYVSRTGGIIFRVGLVLNSNRYFNDKQNWKVRVIPNLRGRIPTTDITFLSKEISRAMRGFYIGEEKNELVHTLISGSTSVVSAFGGGKGINMKIPGMVIQPLLRFLARFSHKARNSEDAYKSLTSTLEKE
jgi:dTDP-4-dehydrorhamnose reductase